MPSLLVASFALLLQTPPAALAPTLKYDMPEGWTTKPLSSKMRVAEFVLPKAEGDSEDAAQREHSGVPEEPSRRITALLARAA